MACSEFVFGSSALQKFKGTIPHALRLEADDIKMPGMSGGKGRAGEIITKQGRAEGFVVNFGNGTSCI